MLKSKIAPIIVGILLLLAAVGWVYVVKSIDYTQMRAKGSYAKTEAPTEAQN